MNARTWKAWLVPGGLLLALTASLINSSLFPQIAPSLSFYYVGAFAAGLVLAARFNSTRLLFSLLVLLLAHRAVDFFAAASPQATTILSAPGRTAAILAALLVPLNFIVFALMRERGLTIAGIAPRFALLFVESVIFAIACRPENNSTYSDQPFTIPIWILLSFAAAILVFVRRFFQTRKPVEPGFVWAVAAVFLWLEFAPLGKVSDAYVATAALILAASLIETSYVLAYHDELTGIRGRRAFNESLLSLDRQYAIAIVDIDHFKKFNDTYGHDVGDQVLCLVAKRLSQVDGDGHAFRCGGEEFAIIFRNTSAKDALPHVDALRQQIENSTFQVRGGDRRAERNTDQFAERNAEKSTEKNVPESAAKPAQSNLFPTDLRTGERDRRRSARKKFAPKFQTQSHDRLSVTVSIGLAEPSTRYRHPEQVIQAADQALYRAKHKGRNRVELASTAPLKIAASKRAKVSRL